MKKVNEMRKKTFYELYLKRFLDILLSLTAITIFAPVLLAVTILVRKKMGKPALFVQPRPGKDEKVFNIYKFRTMTDAKDADGNLLSDEERLTKLGRFIRSTSLDELPQLFNILKGDMSIIGPRPLLVSFLPYYTEKERHRHDVTPGLTGWAQVNGRNTLSSKDKFAYDVEYIRNISFLNDLKIILLTVKKVFIREGIAQGAEYPERLNVERADWLDSSGNMKPEYQEKWNY